LEEKGAERYVRLAATRLLPVLNSFGSEFGLPFVKHLFYTRFHSGSELGSPYRQDINTYTWYSVHSVTSLALLSFYIRLHSKKFFYTSVFIGFIYIRSSDPSLHIFRSTRLGFGLLFSCIWLQSFAVAFRLSSFAFRLSPRGLWSAASIYGSFV
jgi:hypothetical protein